MTGIKRRISRPSKVQLGLTPSCQIFKFLNKVYVELPSIQNFVTVYGLILKIISLSQDCICQSSSPASGGQKDQISQTLRPGFLKKCKLVFDLVLVLIFYWPTTSSSVNYIDTQRRSLSKVQVELELVWRPLLPTPPSSIRRTSSIPCAVLTIFLYSANNLNWVGPL